MMLICAMIGFVLLYSETCSMCISLEACKLSGCHDFLLLAVQGEPRNEANQSPKEKLRTKHH